MNCDPIGEEGSGLNLYRYASNNPVMRVDPTGMADEEVYKIDEQQSIPEADKCRENPESCQSIDPNIKKEENLSKKVSLTDEQIEAVRKELYSLHPECFDAAMAGALAGAKVAKEDTVLMDKNFGIGGVWKEFPNLPERQDKLNINPQVSKNMADYARMAIDKGLPVVVGVNYGVVSSINEGVTDHFLVLTGYETNNEGNAIGFLGVDNVGGVDVKFEVNQETGEILKPKSAGNSFQEKHAFTITQMRLWKELVPRDTTSKGGFYGKVKEIKK